MLSYVLSFSLAGVAVLGVALISMGEDIGADMSFRSMGHLVSETRTKLNLGIETLLLY